MSECDGIFDTNNIADRSIPLTLIRKIPARVASHYKIIPINEENGCLTIAMANQDHEVIEEISVFTNQILKAVTAPLQEIEDGIKKFYGVGAENIEQMVLDNPVPFAETIAAEDPASEADLSRFVEAIIKEAFIKRATDIHFEPKWKGLNVRYRVDGILCDADMPDKIYQFRDKIAARIKILARLDVTEKRRPQDGRFSLRINEDEIDVRVSFLPTPFGESLALRLLPKKNVYSIGELGLSDQQYQILQNVLSAPNGILFLSGPTGSGKTTTLYACLSHLNKGDRKILTIEDPIEYEINGVTQIYVRPELGLTFANGLRSMLRHDPDTMMVGEVRDEETARIAVQVALTGHLVLSTLHTNDAVAGITRLIDMGIAPFLVAETVRCFISQRLVRSICTHCRSLTNPPPDVEDMIRKETGKPGPLVFFKGAGCEKCGGTGYRGRQALFEFFVINKQIRDLITKHVSAEVLSQTAAEQGMRTLRQDGWEKVLMGATTTQEVLRASGGN